MYCRRDSETIIDTIIDLCRNSTKVCQRAIRHRQMMKCALLFIVSSSSKKYERRACKNIAGAIPTHFDIIEARYSLLRKGNRPLAMKMTFISQWRISPICRYETLIETGRKRENEGREICCVMATASSRREIYARLSSKRGMAALWSTAARRRAACCLMTAS